MVTDYIYIFYEIMHFFLYALKEFALIDNEVVWFLEFHAHL